MLVQCGVNAGSVKVLNSRILIEARAPRIMKNLQVPRKGSRPYVVEWMMEKTSGRNGLRQRPVRIGARILASV